MLPRIECFFHIFVTFLLQYKLLVLSSGFFCPFRRFSDVQNYIHALHQIRCDVYKPYIKCKFNEWRKKRPNSQKWKLFIKITCAHFPKSRIYTDKHQHFNSWFEFKLINFSSLVSLLLSFFLSSFLSIRVTCWTYLMCTHAHKGDKCNCCCHILYEQRWHFIWTPLYRLMVLLWN